jgi:hypothetical protein
MAAPAWPVLSEGSCPGDAGETAALVLATQEFVANGGGRPSRRRRRSAVSPGRTSSRGCAGQRGSSAFDYRTPGAVGHGARQASPSWAQAVVSRWRPNPLSRLVLSGHLDRDDRGARFCGAAAVQPAFSTGSQQLPLVLAMGASVQRGAGARMLMLRSVVGVPDSTRTPVFAARGTRRALASRRPCGQDDAVSGSAVNDNAWVGREVARPALDSELEAGYVACGKPSSHGGVRRRVCMPPLRERMV